MDALAAGLAATTGTPTPLSAAGDAAGDADAFAALMDAMAAAGPVTPATGADTDDAAAAPAPAGDAKDDSDADPAPVLAAMMPAPSSPLPIPVGRTSPEFERLAPALNALREAGTATAAAVERGPAPSRYDARDPSEGPVPMVAPAPTISISGDALPPARRSVPSTPALAALSASAATGATVTAGTGDPVTPVAPAPIPPSDASIAATAGPSDAAMPAVAASGPGGTALRVVPVRIEIDPPTVAPSGPQRTVRDAIALATVDILAARSRLPRAPRDSTASGRTASAVPAPPTPAAAAVAAAPSAPDGVATRPTATDPVLSAPLVPASVDRIAADPVPATEAVPAPATLAAATEPSPTTGASAGAVPARPPAQTGPAIGTATVSAAPARRSQRRDGTEPVDRASRREPTPSPAIDGPTPAVPPSAPQPTADGAPRAQAGAVLAAAGGDRQLDIARAAAHADGIARDIAAAAAPAGTARFSIAPERLGTVHVAVTRDGAAADVAIVAASVEARAAIADAQPQLVAEARMHGLELRHTRVEVAADASGTNAQDSSQRQPSPTSLTDRGYAGGAGTGGGSAGGRAQQQQPTSDWRAPRAGPSRVAAAADGAAPGDGLYA